MWNCSPRPASRLIKNFLQKEKHSINRWYSPRRALIWVIVHLHEDTEPNESGQIYRRAVASNPLWFGSSYFVPSLKNCVNFRKIFKSQFVVKQLNRSFFSFSLTANGTYNSSNYITVLILVWHSIVKRHKRHSTLIEKIQRKSCTHYNIYLNAKLLSLSVSTTLEQI